MATPIYEFAQLPHGMQGKASRKTTRVARKPGQAPTVGVIYNPRSHRNKGEDFDCGFSPHVHIAQPGDREQLPQALESLAKRNIDLLIINGGDGTVRDVLTCGQSVFGDDWPPIAVLPKGKTNALTVDLEVPLDITLQGAIDALDHGRRVRRRPISITALSGAKSRVLGFFMGAGSFTIATQTGQSAHRLGAFNSVVVGVSIAWGILQSLLGSRKNMWRRGTKMDIRLDSSGAPLAHSGLGDRDRRQLLVASTLERLPAGAKPFGALRQGLKLLVIDQISRRTTAMMPAIVFGKGRKDLRERGCHIVSASRFTLEIDDRFILDGEVFPVGKYRIEQGPELEFVAPAVGTDLGLVAPLAAPASAPAEAPPETLEAQDQLIDRIHKQVDASVAPLVSEFAAHLAEAAGAKAVLFYGSNLRTGSLEGVLDFYVLLPGRQRDRIWPRVSYHEHKTQCGQVLRAKVATMGLNAFAQATKGERIDTTIWARFVQPSALVWRADDAAKTEVISALANAVKTAARLALCLGPKHGTTKEYWRGLFAATYQAEFRVERTGREQDILSVNPEHFAGLLPLAMSADGIGFVREGDQLTPYLGKAMRKRVLAWWRSRRLLSKPLNVARLLKASTTFEGAARYAAWKIERHSGMPVQVTPFRERFPILAAPSVLIALWRYRREQEKK
ncbi:MAG: diacylglycerol kinase family protein [Erythrobacter sp.]